MNPLREAFGEEAETRIEGLDARPFNEAVPVAVPPSGNGSLKALDRVARSAPEKLRLRSRVVSSPFFPGRVALPEPEKEPVPDFAEPEVRLMILPVLFIFRTMRERGIPLQLPEAAERAMFRSPFCSPFRPPGNVPSAVKFFRLKVPGPDIWAEERFSLIVGEDASPLTTALPSRVPLILNRAISGARISRFSAVTLSKTAFRSTFPAGPIFPDADSRAPLHWAEAAGRVVWPFLKEKETEGDMNVSLPEEIFAAQTFPETTGTSGVPLMEKSAFPVPESTGILKPRARENAFPRLKERADAVRFSLGAEVNFSTVPEKEAVPSRIPAFPASFNISGVNSAESSAFDAATPKRLNSRDRNSPVPLRESTGPDNLPVKVSIRPPTSFKAGSRRLTDCRSIPPAEKEPSAAGIFPGEKRREKRPVMGTEAAMASTGEKKSLFSEKLHRASALSRGMPLSNPLSR